MNTTIDIPMPYAKRHLISEVKLRGGKFNPDSKTWKLDDTTENRALIEMIGRPLAAPSPGERVSNVAKLAIDLLNGLKHRQFKIIECGDRILIESTSLSTTQI